MGVKSVTIRGIDTKSLDDEVENEDTMLQHQEQRKSILEEVKKDIRQAKYPRTQVASATILYSMSYASAELAYTGLTNPILKLYHYNPNSIYFFSAVFATLATATFIVGSLLTWPLIRKYVLKS